MELAASHQGVCEQPGLCALAGNRVAFLGVSSVWLCAWCPLVSSGRGTERAPAWPGALSAAGALPAGEQAVSWQGAALSAAVLVMRLTPNCRFRVCSPLHSSLRSSRGGLGLQLGMCGHRPWHPVRTPSLQ